MQVNFLDNTVADRIKIILIDKDPIYVYQILQKHFVGQSIEELKKDYKITLDIFRSKIFFEASEEKISKLLNYFITRGFEIKWDFIKGTKNIRYSTDQPIEAIELNKLTVKLEPFFEKII